MRQFTFKAIVLIFSLFVANKVAEAKCTHEKKVVCYFGSWAVYRNGNGKYEIPLTQAHLCTHFIYTFAGLYDGVIKSLDPYADLPSGLNGYGKVLELKRLNPDLKVLIAMGGWNEGSQKYSDACSSEKSRVKLADSILKFLTDYGFDGFDLDWEYPNQRGGKPSDKANLILFLKELKLRLSPRNLLLSIAVGASENAAALSYQIAEIAKQVDFINLMSYDYHGASWERVVGINAPLYASPLEPSYLSRSNADGSVRNWIKNGAPAEKIILGVPFYGQSFRLADPSRTQIMSPSTGPGNAGPYTAQAGTLSYLEICELFKRETWTHNFEKDQKVPYSYRGDQWVGYDNAQSLTEKANYVKQNNLGGMMIWSIESDDFRGVCGESFPLLKSINKALNNGQCTTDEISGTTAATGQTWSAEPKSTTARQTWSDESTSTTKRQTPKPGSGSACTKQGWIRDDKDCSIFYWCQPTGRGYNKVKFNCPPGLHFDLNAHVCNYPDQAKCNV